jgi:alpha-tubulin suppressor-like RCC1 family protein
MQRLWQILRRGIVLGVASLAGCLDPMGAPPPGFQYTSVSTGAAHTCGLSLQQELFCWGSAEHGQLGDGTRRSAATPRRVALPEPVAAVSAGGSHTCALSTAGSLWCWGDNRRGQLGAHVGAFSAEPVLIAAAPAGEAARIDATSSWSAVSAGREHTCGLHEGGDVFCWGGNDHGQLGIGSLEDVEAPAAVGGALRAVTVSAGGRHTCAVANDGAAFCWGLNDHGQLGDGGARDASLPVPVAGATEFRSITAGALHSCGIGADGFGYCWGSNVHGELGNGGSMPPGYSGATEPGVLATFTAGDLLELSAGRHVTCAVAASYGSLCWGRGLEGQLGIGRRVDHYWPQITIFPDFAYVVVNTISGGGDTHTCGVAAGGALYCWGEGLSGQLGIGATIALNPARVLGERRR